MTWRRGYHRVAALDHVGRSLLLLQEARSSWNVQLELGADHHLDEATFRQAVLSCCRRHPLTRARLATARNGETSYQWDLADDVDRDPVRVADCPDGAALDRLRAELYTPPIELDVSPGMRLVLARRPHGDLVLLSVSHVVADGVGAVRLMQTITRAYLGKPDPHDPLPLDQARDLGETTTPGLMQRASGTTVNDVLLAALHLTVEAWNSQHGVSTGRIGVMMPVNVRPAHRLWDVVSNLTSNVSVSTAPDDRVDLATATAAMAEQTYQMRRQDRAYGLHDLLEVIKKVPLPVKRAVPRLLPLAGDRFVDTAMLSNLGRVPEPPTSPPGLMLGRRSCGSPRRATAPAASPSESPPSGSDSRWSPVTATTSSMPLLRKRSPIS